MTQRGFTKQIFYRFFFPSLISSLCLAVANLVDALSVGILLGEPALAAISLVSPIYMLFNVLDVGLAVGGAVTFARLMAEGRVKKAAALFHQLLLCALVVSAAIALLGTLFLAPILSILGAGVPGSLVYELTRDYALRLLLATPLFFLNLLFYHFIRCDDGERRASVGLAVANLLDVALSFILVLGFGLGVKGAIWSTIIGTATGVVIYLPHFFVRSNILSLRLKLPDWTALRRCFATGFSSSSQYVYQFLFFLVVNNLLMRLHGESALAVFNVVLNLSYVVMGLYDGVGGTIQPLAATFSGERNREAERYTLRLALRWGLALGTALLAAIALFAPDLARLFGLADGTVGMGALALRLYCLGGFFAGVSAMLGSYWQAVGQERRTLVLTLLRSFGVYLLLAVPLAFGPLEVFWWVFPATEVASLGIFGLWQALKRQRLAFSNLDRQPIYARMLQEDVEELSVLLEEVEEFSNQQGAAFDQTFLVTMAVEEMCQAIFAHGMEVSRQDIYIQITLFPVERGLFELHIRDNAPPFDPFSLHTGKISEAEDEATALDSMGVLMVKKKAKEFYYRHYQGFNTLTVRI